MVVQTNPDVSIEDQKMNERMVKIVYNAIERSRIKGAPIALYDAEKKRPYLLYADGKREYAD